MAPPFHDPLQRISLNDLPKSLNNIIKEFCTSQAKIKSAIINTKQKITNIKDCLQDSNKIPQHLERKFTFIFKSNPFLATQQSQIVKNHCEAEIESLQENLLKLQPLVDELQVTQIISTDFLPLIQGTDLENYLDIDTFLSLVHTEIAEILMSFNIKKLKDEKAKKAKTEKFKELKERKEEKLLKDITDPKTLHQTILGLTKQLNSLQQKLKPLNHLKGKRPSQHNSNKKDVNQKTTNSKNTKKPSTSIKSNSQKKNSKQSYSRRK